MLDLFVLSFSEQKISDLYFRFDYLKRIIQMPVCLRFANAEIKSEYLKGLQFRGREQSKRETGNNFFAR